MFIFHILALYHISRPKGRGIRPDDANKNKTAVAVCCPAAKKIVLPKKVKRIMPYAFDSCRMLKSVAVPHGVENIEEFAFSECVRIKEIYLPNTIKTIRDRAFDSCVDLEKITFPDSVKEIYEDAFLDCRNLKEIILLSKNPVTVQRAKQESRYFKKCLHKVSSIYVPASSVEQYKKSDWWKDVADKISPATEEMIAEGNKPYPAPLPKQKPSKTG